MPRVLKDLKSGRYTIEIFDPMIKQLLFGSCSFSSFNLCCHLLFLVASLPYHFVVFSALLLSVVSWTSVTSFSRLFWTVFP